MDFLDPRKTRKRRRRLIAWYVAMALIIAVGTVVLVYGAYGYKINTKTGQITESGLLFLDSKPGGATIYLNGKAIGQNTSARLVLPEGTYTITLKKNGYRDWQRTAKLPARYIDRFVYPFLFPQNPVVTTIKTYSAAPPLMTQTPDLHWLLVQVPGTTTVTFDQYDTTKLTKPSTVVTLPASVLTDPGAAGSKLSEVEWSTDNNHLLLKHTYPGGSEFVVLNRTDPSQSFNVNRMFNIAPSQVALKNKKTNQLYIYSQKAKTLQLGDTGKKTLAAPFLRHVLAFKPYGPNIVDYVSDNLSSGGQVQARIWNNGPTYLLSTFPAGSAYILDTASFQGHLYFIAGSNTEARLDYYKDPLNDIKDPNIGHSIPLLTLQAAGVTKGSFSDNARFIAIEGGQHFAVYDMETKTRYQYTLKTPINAPLHWMDGHRLMGTSRGSVFVMDYDSANQQKLVPTSYAPGGYFSPNFNQLLTFAPAKGGSAVTFEQVDMRAGSDLPKRN